MNFDNIAAQTLRNLNTTNLAMIQKASISYNKEKTFHIKKKFFLTPNQVFLHPKKIQMSLNRFDSKF